MKPRKIGTSHDGKTMHYSAGILVECDGQYLLMDRLNFPFGFACPGGHIDEGEDSKTSAIRELMEETGIIVGDLEFLCEEEIPWNHCKSAPVHYWFLYKISVKSKEVKINSREAKSLGWYSVKEMSRMKIEEVWLYWFKKLKIIKEF